MSRIAFVVVALCAACTSAACTAISGADTLSSETQETPVGGPESASSSASSSSSGSASSSSGSTSSSSGTTTSSSSGTTTTSSSSSTTTSSSGTTSSSSSGSTGNPNTGTFLINELFDGQDACKKGAVTNGGVVTSSGLGECQICATKEGDTLYSLSTTLTTTNKITIDANVRRLAGTSPAQAIVQLSIGGASISTAATLSTTYTRVTAGSASSGVGAQVTATIGIKTGVPGDCIVLDDLRVPVK